MLKWAFLIRSVPVPFDGVQTRGLVDAPRKVLQEMTATVHCPLFLMCKLCQPCVICSLASEKWHGFCRARTDTFRFSWARDAPCPFGACVCVCLCTVPSSTGQQTSRTALQFLRSFLQPPFFALFDLAVLNACWSPRLRMKTVCVCVCGSVSERTLPTFLLMA